MPGNPAVLILSDPRDAPAKVVQAGLSRYGISAVIFDPATFPSEAQLTARYCDGQWSTQIVGDGYELSLGDVISVWLRRPGMFRVNPNLTSGARRFAIQEAQIAIGGLLQTLDCLWVNRLERAVVAECKPLQLKYATAVGFEVPRSLITNDPDAAIAFFEECDGNVVYKPLSTSYLQTEPGGSALNIYTSIVEREHLELAGAISATACLFQEHVAKKTELRITLIGDEVFPVQIDSQHAPKSSVDWRRGYEHLRYRIYPLPRSVRSRCLELNKCLGLVFSTMDFIITPDDDLIFLEVNPSGEWAWLEVETGLPMTEAMTDLLRCANDTMVPNRGRRVESA
jgi:glutathione synthase/RimK-type ligase-like ATP-grasp enzyme